MTTAEAIQNEDDFAALAERHRRELQLHCYRMLGSLEDAQDAVQETFLRAWRGRETFEGRATFRAWLYGIATNAALDAIAKKDRRMPAPANSTPSFEVPWLQPYPDHLLAGVAPAEDQPDAAAVSKETVELAFLVAIQHLPPIQRAALILRDVLGWPAKETALLLETTVPSVTSALQRARAGLKRHLPERRLEWSAGSEPSQADRDLVQRFIDATERGDAAAFVEMFHDDARFSMPPEGALHVGSQRIVDSWVEGGFGAPDFGDFRCVATSANMQPAVACYVRRPGESEFKPLAVDVLRIEGGRVAEILGFPLDPEAFGLPATL